MVSIVESKRVQEEMPIILRLRRRINTQTGNDQVQDQDIPNRKRAKFVEETKEDEYSVSGSVNFGKPITIVAEESNVKPKRKYTRKAKQDSTATTEKEPHLEGPKVTSKRKYERKSKTSANYAKSEAAQQGKTKLKRKYNRRIKEAHVDENNDLLHVDQYEYPTAKRVRVVHGRKLEDQFAREEMEEAAYILCSLRYGSKLDEIVTPERLGSAEGAQVTSKLNYTRHSTRANSDGNKLLVYSKPIADKTTRSSQLSIVEMTVTADILCSIRVARKW